MSKGRGAWLAFWLAVALAGVGVWLQEPRLMYSAAIVAGVAAVLGLFSDGPRIGM